MSLILDNLPYVDDWRWGLADSMVTAAQGCFMLHQSKLVEILSGFAAGPDSGSKSRLSLVPSSKPKEPAPDIAPGQDIAAAHEDAPARRFAFLEVAGERCSAYLAEAAVLVLVFAILDRFLMKEKMEWTWAGGAVAVSLGLLMASIAVEIAVRRHEDEAVQD